jgi:hypothetical protein
MEDLLAGLAPTKPRTLDFQRCVARPGGFREHNALVVTARGRPIEEGLVLDAWRKSGELVWAPFRADRYPWRTLARSSLPAPE